MIIKALKSSQRKFKRERINEAIFKLRRDLGIKVSQIETGLISSFQEGFIQGYNASNAMWAKKTKEPK